MSDPKETAFASESLEVVVREARVEQSPLITTHLPPSSVKEILHWSPEWRLDKRPVDAVAWIDKQLPESLLTLPRGFLLPARLKTPTERSLYLRQVSPGYRRAYDELRALYGEKVRIEERVEWEGNLLTNAGMDFIWDTVIGTAVTAFSNANAYIGVGDSSTAAAVGQTDLIASTNKLRKGMNATYPDQPANSQVRFQSDFTGAEANFAWLEVGTFNGSSGGTMLQRVVPSGGLGTKSSGATWTITLTITLS